MELTLMLVTLLALALALGMGALVWHLLKDERARADARVAALVEGFALQQQQQSTAPAARTSSADASPSASDMGERDWLLEFPASDAARRLAEPEPAATSSWHGAEAEAVAASADGVGLGLSGGASASTYAAPSADEPDEPNGAAEDLPLASHSAHVLFQQVEQADEAEGANRLMSLGVAAALLVGLVLAIWTVTHLVITAAAAPPAAASSPPIAAGPARAAATAPAPLELLTLTHAQSGETLTISGRVRNPSSGASQSQLSAIVSFYNARGDLLTSVRAPLDFRVLAPGDESPFQASTVAPSGASKFRVSFRQDNGSGRTDGAIVPHVDRRQQAGAGS